MKRCQREFSSKSKPFKWFLACFLLESFIKFPVNLDYEPLLQFTAINLHMVDMISIMIKQESQKK